jgi:hypothetical protein
MERQHRVQVYAIPLLHGVAKESNGVSGGGHFKALAVPSIIPTSKQAFTVMDLLQSQLDPATSKCVNFHT